MIPCIFRGDCGRIPCTALPGVERGNARSNRVGFCCHKSKNWKSDGGQAQDSHTWKHCRAVGQELAHVGTMSRLDTLRWMTMSNLHCWQRLQDVQSSGKLLGLRACQLLADSGRIPQSLSWISWPVSAVHTWASSCASQIGIA